MLQWNPASSFYKKQILNRNEWNLNNKSSHWWGRNPVGWVSLYRCHRWSYVNLLWIKKNLFRIFIFQKSFNCGVCIYKRERERRKRELYTTHGFNIWVLGIELRSAGLVLLPTESILWFPKEKFQVGFVMRKLVECVDERDCLFLALWRKYHLRTIMILVGNLYSFLTYLLCDAWFLVCSEVCF